MRKLLIFAVIAAVMFNLVLGTSVRVFASVQPAYEDKKDDGNKEDTKEDNDLNKEQIAKKISKFFEVIGELKVKTASLTDSKLQDKVNKILSKVEAKVLSIKQDLAEIDAGNIEELAKANVTLSKLKSLVKKAEALLEDQDVDTKLDVKDIDKLIADVERKLDHLGKQIVHVQEKINSKEGKGKNVKDIQALLEEIKNSFGEAGIALAAAKTAYKAGDIEEASTQIYIAVSASRIAKRMMEKIDFGQMRDKNKDRQEGKFSIYDELVFKVKKFMEIIGEIRAVATGLDNEAKILASLGKAEKRVQAIYTEILAIGPSGSEDDFDTLDDDLEAVKRVIKKTQKLVKEGKEDIDDDVLRTEEAQKSAEEILERAEARYGKFLKNYNSTESTMSDDQKTIIQDLLEKAKTNLDTAQTYFSQEDYDNAQSYGYSSLVVSKTGMKLLKIVK